MNKETVQLLEQHFDTAFAAPDLPAGKAGGIKKLRELILTLAMQGKLVEQNPNDPPASDLLKEIEAEKQRLIKEKQIKKPKPLPPIKLEEMPHKIPSNWEWVRFGKVAQHNSGKTLDKGRNTGEPRDYITTSNLYWGRFELDNVRQMLIKDEELEKCTARKNDLLICEGGEAGRAAVWCFDSEVCFQNHVHRARFFKDIDPYFAYRFFEKLNATGEINKYRKGVGISNMSSKSLASILFPFPPLSEQRRIVARIDQLMARCDELEKLRTEREEKRLAVHAAAIKQLLDTESRDSHSNAWQFLARHFGELYTVKENVAELRKAILQLAVMGKLVPPVCRQAGKTPTTLPPPEPGAWWVYVIECEDSSFYKGFTEDLPRRWKQHVAGTACNWTRSHSPKQVFYWEKCYSKESAIQREEFLKSGLGREWFKREVVENEKGWQSASELLQEIKAEKQRLIKEKKIKKPKPLPPIRPEEIPYELPEGWEWVRLGEAMLKITDGTHHSPANYETGDFLYISAKNIKDDGVLLGNASYVTKAVHDDIFSRCDPEYGNILYIKDGATTGIVTINNLKEPFSMLSSVALLKQPSQVDNNYLLFTLRAPFFYEEMRAGMMGFAITRVTLKKLQDAIIPLPPLPEQHRIVAKIDQLMALCDELEQQIDNSAGKQTDLLNAVMAQV